MIYEFHRRWRTYWRAIMGELDQSGFGRPIREFLGRLVAELTGKTGERGKGINFMQAFWFCMIVVMFLRNGWTPFWVSVFTGAALALFPSLQRLVGGVYRLARSVSPNEEVYWDAEPPHRRLPQVEAAGYESTVASLVSQRVETVIRRWLENR